MYFTNNNFVNLIGYIGQDPEAKTLPSGQLVVEMSLATNNRYVDRDGNKVTSTDWHRIKAYGRTGEVLNQYLSKGSKVAIVGTLRYNKWVDKHDQNRTSTDVVVNSFEFLDSKPRSGENYDNSQQPADYDTATSSAYEPPLDARRPSTKQKASPTDNKTKSNAKEKLPF